MHPSSALSGQTTASTKRKTRSVAEKTATSPPILSPYFAGASEEPAISTHAADLRPSRMEIDGEEKDAILHDPTARERRSTSEDVPVRSPNADESKGERHAASSQWWTSNTAATSSHVGEQESDLSDLSDLPPDQEEMALDEGAVLPDFDDNRLVWTPAATLLRDLR